MASLTCLQNFAVYYFPMTFRPCSFSFMTRTLLFVIFLLTAPYSIAANAIAQDQSAEIQADLYTNNTDDLMNLLTTQHQGDLFEIIDRGVLRVLVTYSKTHYFIEQGTQHGLSYEMLREFESYLNKRYRSRRKGKSLSVVPIPVARDELISSLNEGRAELAVANLTITPDRKELSDFSIPVYKHVSEVIIASPSAPKLNSIDDLSGKTLFIRESSSFFTHIQKLNQTFESRGLSPAIVIEADEHLEVEDLLEMANAELIDYTVADQHIAELWSKIFADLIVYKDMPIHKDGQIAWAVRKHSPNLLYEVNRFLKRHRSGTLFGNIVKKRYLENPYWANKALSTTDKTRFLDVTTLFKKYADIYDFNHLMLLAQGYQESRLDHSKKSPVGAIGIMQLMPQTGKAMKVGSIKELDNNVHAGTKYLRKIIDHYFDDPNIDEQNRVLFSFAAYNAGPTRIKRLRRKTAKLGLDPNKWFGNVEHTVARYIGKETVSYVANISKYFIAYRLIEEQSKIRSAVKQSASDLL